MVPKKGLLEEEEKCYYQAEGQYWCLERGQKEIHEMTNAFFQKLYDREDEVNPHEILELVSERVSTDLNSLLTKPFSALEVSEALFQIGPLKAPGPDDILARFYQRNWEVLREDMVKGVLNFFDTGIMPEGINDTVIVLIPKGKDPQSLKDYRPISLCNVIYKVVSKCLVNRLRPILDGIISETQSAFIPGRMITDNAIIAFECFHKIQHCQNAQDTYCAYKLDLGKAYDMVDWTFLEGVLLKIGFSGKWTNWVMECVKSVRYSVRCNGDLLEPFKPSRGLR